MVELRTKTSMKKLMLHLVFYFKHNKHNEKNPCGIIKANTLEEFQLNWVFVISSNNSKWDHRAHVLNQMKSKLS